MTTQYTITQQGDAYVVLDRNQNFVAKTYATDTARLIAASPTLLKACQAAAEFIEGIQFNDTLTEFEENLLEQLKSAIAKATIYD